MSDYRACFQEGFDEAAIDRFAVVLKQKMAAGRAKGRYGWHDPDDCSQDQLADSLREHVEKGDPVDVALFAMFLWFHGWSCAEQPEMKAAA